MHLDGDEVTIFCSFVCLLSFAFRISLHFVHRFPSSSLSKTVYPFLMISVRQSIHYTLFLSQPPGDVVFFSPPPVLVSFVSFVHLQPFPTTEATQNCVACMMMYE